MAVDSNALIVLVLFRCARCAERRRIGRFHPRTASGRRFVRSDQVRYLRHMLGMLIVGVLMYLLFRTLGQYYVDGVGYATIQAVLAGPDLHILAAGAAVVCKALATSLSLGSGSSGGIFSPSLFMGATLGGGFAALLNAPACRFSSASPPSRWSAWVRWWAAAPAR
jgi:CIC family chloride channel protein